MKELKKPEIKMPPRFRDSPLRLLAVSFEAIIDKAYRFVKLWQGKIRLPLTVIKHNVLGYPGGVVVQGRVMATSKLEEPKVDDSAWVNLSRMLRHWLTDEEPYAQVEVECCGVVIETNSDEEGYFEAIFEHPDASTAEEVQVRLPYSHSRKWRKISILRAPINFNYLLISDIDDTILETNAASIVKMLKTTFLGNVLTRQVFDGIPELYRKLTTNGNPIFYVTSSPWNLRGFLRSVFDRYELPNGGFFMTDWGLDKEKWFTKSHHVHKHDSIDQILHWYPGKSAILVGDSGQKDPEIYIEIAKRHSGRILSILIRNVSHTKPWREIEVHRIAEQAKAEGVPIEIFNNTAEMETALAKRLPA